MDPNMIAVHPPTFRPAANDPASTAVSGTADALGEEAKYVSVLIWYANSKLCLRVTARDALTRP